MPCRNLETAGGQRGSVRCFQISLIHPPATEQDSQLPQNLKDLLASALPTVTLGQLLGTVLSGVSLAEPQNWLRAGAARK